MTVLPHFRCLSTIALAVALAGCASLGSNTDTAATSAIPAPPTTGNPEDTVKYWGDLYATKNKDRDAALNYAAALVRTDRNDQAVAVLQKAVINFPSDRDVLAAYGKALAANGQLDQALNAIRRAQTPDMPDYKLLSAEAAILDQIGQHSDARRMYNQALDLAPNDPSVLSNLGMSYVLTGELTDAERLLRKAIAVPGADGRVRQNLALVIGLQGRFDEAQKIAVAELPPDQAAANIAYLKRMLAEQNTWQRLQEGAKPTG